MFKWLVNAVIMVASGELFSKHYIGKYVFIFFFFAVVRYQRKVDRFGIITEKPFNVD